jgi:hypothetical protein
MNEEKIMKFLEKNPITAGAVLPSLATFTMVGILLLGMWTVDKFI